MMADRTIWTGNEHIQIDWSRVKVGDVVDTVDVTPKSCPVLVGPSVWHVLMIAPNSEPASMGRLTDAGFRCYWPKVYKFIPTKQRTATGQVKMERVARPMFPGYIFADLRREVHDFGAPLKVKGVRGYLWREAVDSHGKSTREPCVLPDSLYAAMVARESDAEAGSRKRPKPFKIGEHVRVKEGHFRDFIGEIEEMDERGRVKALLSIFAQQTPVWMSSEILERA